MSNDHLDEIAPTALLAGRTAVLPATSVPCLLTIVEGPDAGRSFTLDDVATRRILIGQSPACDVRLSDRTVSRRHAALEADDAGVRIVDLHSSNGTWVNDVRVRDVYLTGGEVVRLGSTVVRVQTAPSPAILEAPESRSFFRVLGASPEMRRLYPVFERLAAANVPILIEGETGTGKEVLAESLHDASARRDNPFVIFDCTTVSASLLDAELFGHERGAFTGAVESRRGLFEEADGGTLFIDEIGDLSLDLQSKLLRALERSEVRRVGSNRWTRVDVRVICATRRDLDREVQERRFRDDLFYRLAVARVELPPLRKRQGDISMLARAFWTALGGDARAIPPDLLYRFEQYEWPGNVRELHNAVARYLALGDTAFHEPADFAPTQSQRGSIGDFLDEVIRRGQPLPLAREEVVAEFERRYVARALENHGSVGAAAAALGIGRRYFQKLRAKR